MAGRVKHGTRTAYVQYRCRCAPCRLAEAQYAATRRITKAGRPNINQALKLKICEILNDLSVLTH